MIPRFDRLIFSLVALTLPLLPIAAQTAPERSVWDTLAIPQFRHLEYPRDLPMTPTVITQDRTGMIWIGTQDGLARWDGYHSRVFHQDPKDPLSLPGNFVTALTVDDRGTLFVVTSSGVIARFDPVAENFRPLPPVATATGLIFGGMVSDGNGGLWIGNSNGLSHFNAEANRWEAANLPANLNVRSILLARDGTIWVGSEQGLLRYNQATASFTAIAGINEQSTSAVRALFQSARGDIWFGRNDGTYGAVNGNGEVRLVSQVQPPTGVKGITEVRRGVLALATDSSGLNFVDEASGKVVQSIHYDPGRPSGIGGNLIFSEFLDRSGGLWIAQEHGTDYLAPGTGAFLSLLPSDRDPTAFSGRNISGLAVRKDGKLWVGSEEGADIFSPITGKESASAKIPGTIIRNFTTTGSDQTWISSFRGLYLHEKGQTRQIPAFSDSQIGGISAEGNTLWISVEKRGLARYDTQTGAVTYYVHDPKNPHSISDNAVLEAVRDHKGRLWVGTMHGLNLFENGQFTQFFHGPADPNSLPSDVILALLVDRQDRLWIGTQGGGIAMLDLSASSDKVTIRRVHVQGALSNSVGTIVEDEQGQIWGGTDLGLIRIDPASLTGRSFGDDLPISAYWREAGTRAPDGTLLFGGIGGVTIVHPDRLSDEMRPAPPVIATAVHIGGRSFSPLEPPVLPPDDHNLQVEFSALDYAHSAKISYAYKLDGFDKAWTETDADHRQAVYTNLPPGHYTLQLRAAASPGVWSNQPTRIAVTVMPAWYQTWWFKVCIALAAIGAIVIFVRSRTALLRHRQKELEGQVAERTAEIASLLHNSGEGFLSFSASLIIDRQYSRACETFLGEIPAGKNAAALLFAENPRHVAFVTESVPTALAAADSHKRDLILSLLPKEIDRRGRRLRLHYSIIENGHLMVVLRDITTERRLTERVASEHRRLEMIVAAVTDSRDFFEAVSSYQLFIKSELPEMINSEDDTADLLRGIYRSVHTFKGIFNQFSFERTPALLHQLEEQLDSLQRRQACKSSDISSLFDLEQLTSSLEQDLTVIRQAMGDEFLTKGGHVTMPPVQAARIKQLAALWRSGETFDPTEEEIRDLLDQIDRVGSVSLKAELAAYDQTIAQVARRMEKEVAPLTVTCDEEIWLDPDLYGPFLRSLIHVFRNCVAHGIETPEGRIEAGKDEQGQIFCIVEMTGSRLTIEIADDGAGVDVTALRRRAVHSGRIGVEKIDLLSDQEAVDLIFLDHITTSNTADDWSGRGVGLAAVRQEVERLGGTVSVQTERGKGTRFLFSFQLERTLQQVGTPRIENA